MVRPVAERALRLPAFRKQCPDAGKQVLLAGVAAPLRVVCRVRRGAWQGGRNADALGLGSLGFVDTLLEALLAAMAAAVKFLLAFNFLVSHLILPGEERRAFPPV